MRGLGSKPEPQGLRRLFSGPGGFAMGAAVVPFVFTFHVNGVQYVAMLAGVVAIVAGGLGLRAARAQGGPAAAAGIAVVLGLFHVYQSNFWMLF
jgi:hypothetical protein